MASIVTIQSIDAMVVKADANGRGEKTFTITNISGGALRIGLQCVFDNAEQKDWARPRGDIERDLGDQGSDQVIVDLTVPKNAAPGKYEFKLLVYSTINPNLAFTESDTVVIEVAEQEPEPVKKPFPWWIPVTAVVSVLLIAGIITWVLWPSSMPEVVGKPIDEAITLLEAEGILRDNINITEEYTGSSSEGYVKTQDPEADSDLEDEEKFKVNLVVEAFTKVVPAVIGKTVAQAEDALSSAGLTVGKITQEMNSQKTGGTILKTDPATGNQVVPGTAINLTVVTATIKIPVITGQKLSEAKRILEQLGLRVNVEQVKTAGEALRVLSTKPPSSSEVKPGSTIVLVVVKQMVKVISMVGQTEAQAKATIKRLNLKLGAVRYKATTSRRSGTVYSHIPARGAEVNPLSRVTLIIAKTPPKPTVAVNKTLTINVKQNVDLDRGVLNAGSNADIRLRLVNPFQPPLFEVINGARIGRIGNTPVGWGCSKSGYGNRTSYPSSSLSKKYLCIRTKNGKYSELRVSSVPKMVPFIAFATAKMSFKLTTWNPPKPLKQPVTAKYFSMPALMGLKVIRRELAPLGGLEEE